jgi:hypothetical protein
MAWSYDATRIATSPLFQCRRLIGDVLSGDQQLQDEEINYTLGKYSTVYGAAAELCRDIAAQFARKVDTVQAELRIMYSAQTKRYMDMARDFEMRSLRGAVPYAGGISITDKTNVATDPDRVPPDFNRGEFDNLLPVGPVGQQTPIPGSPDAVDTASETFP